MYLQPKLTFQEIKHSLHPRSHQENHETYHRDAPILLSNHSPLPEPDILFHLAVHDMSHLQERFGGVKMVLTGGSTRRVTYLAHAYAQKLGLDTTTINPVGDTDRFTMYCVGKTIMVSHGIGIPSIMIVLNEVTKLLYHARARGVTYIRFGTSGTAIEAKPGTIVVSRDAVASRTQALTTFFSKPVSFCGELVNLMTSIPPIQNQRMMLGTTLSAMDFYDGQFRLDGALGYFSSEDRIKFLASCRDNNIANIEMEGYALASFCRKAKICAGMVCIIVVNRWQGDQIITPESELKVFEQNLIDYVIKLIDARLAP